MFFLYVPLTLCVFKECIVFFTLYGRIILHALIIILIDELKETYEF